MALKFYTNVSKEFELKVRKFLGLILTFVEVTWEKLLPLPPHPEMVKVKAQEARVNQFLFQNVQIMKFLKSPKYSKSIIELYPFWVNVVKKLKIVSLS